MPLGEPLASVRERDVKLDDQVPVAWQIQGTARTFAALDDTEERKRGELPFGVALLDTRPDGRAKPGGLV